jgi:mannosyltransferase OCH1-like enzyme
MLYERLRRSPNARIFPLTLLLICSVWCLNRVAVVSLPSRRFAQRHSGNAELQVASEPSNSAQHIPAILHQVYLDGEDDLLQKESDPSPRPGQRFPGYNRTWRASCRSMHPGWKYMFWNNSAAEQLIQTRYPWFLATFRSYSSTVQKGKV